MSPEELNTFFHIIRQALLLNPAVYAAIQSTSVGVWVALAVVLLASLSEAAGQSIVLFLNRIRPTRLWLAIGISTASQFAGYFIWSFTVWWVGRVVFQHSQPFPAVASAVGLAYAPQIFSFFVLIPFLGDGIGLLLSLWTMVAVVIAIHMGLNLETWQAVSLAVLGWLLLQGVRRTIGRPVIRVQRWLTDRVAGVPLRVQTRDLPQVRRRPLRNWYMQLESWRSHRALRPAQSPDQQSSVHEQHHV